VPGLLDATIIVQGRDHQVAKISAGSRKRQIDSNYRQAARLADGSSSAFSPIRNHRMRSWWRNARSQP
jgi:hypothetical protein